MELVQPIRDKEVINKFKNELLKNGYRDYMLFV
ncbi:site-specific integrase, partial [Clostridium botulinum]|nr:site-specific integrase [Clostridium botulinum]